MNFRLQKGVNNIWYGVFSHLQKLPLRHGVSTRLQGRSSEPYAKLNLGLHIGDLAQQAIENRRLFCQAVGVKYDSMVTAEQVHGQNIVAVSKVMAGRGKDNYAEALPATDALITNEPNIPLMLFFADCVPVLIADPVSKAVGIAHAGWQGTVGKIAQKTVLAMQSKYGTKPENCLIGIGPSIGPCCYEVDEQLARKVQKEFVFWQNLLTAQKTDGKKQHWLLDLWQANQQQLTEIGIVKENIYNSAVCTACNTELFFSHRAEHGQTGRQGAVIALDAQI